MLIVGSLALLLIDASPAMAGSREDAEALFLEGVERLKAGDAEGSLERLERAVAKDPHPTLLYNLGALYDRAGNKAKAVTYYARYLTTEPEDGALVLARLRQIDPTAAEAAMNAARPTEPVAAATSPQPKKAMPRPPGPAKPGPSGGGGGRIAAFAVTGVGVAALLAGGAFGALTLADMDDFLTARSRGAAEAAAGEARTHQTIANVAFATGAGAVLAGGVMLLLGGSSATSTGPGALALSF